MRAETGTAEERYVCSRRPLNIPEKSPIAQQKVAGFNACRFWMIKKKLRYGELESWQI